MRKYKAKLPILLAVWFLANFVPHIVIFLLTGKIYYRLSPYSMIVAEASIMLLNFILPVAVLYYFSPQGSSVMHRLGWRWNGWRIVWIGLAGFIITMIIMVVIQQFIGNPISSPSQKFHPQEMAMLIILLLVITAAGEETMFRGYIQMELAQSYGALIGVIGTAFLFGLRHLPMDLYNGITQHAPLSAWTSRMLQLYLFALFLGIARHWAKSTWASWIMHEGVLVLIVLLGLLAANK
jgi:membrane protease YdiL (CAAX protease family)